MLPSQRRLVDTTSCRSLKRLANSEDLSAFEVGRARYVVVMREAFFGPEPDERRMRAGVSAAMPPVGSAFAYEYDFGSTALR